MTKGAVANLTVVTEGPEHVRGTVATTPPIDAVIVEFPAVLQVKIPEPSNGATATALLAHVEVEVTFAVLPSEYFAVA